MDVELREVLSAVDGEALTPLNEEPIRAVSSDTRTLEKGDLFFALSGQKFDGHHFIDEAIKKGARHFVVSRGTRLTAAQKKAANFIGVNDTLTAYGDLARVYRQKFKIPVIAVTGSAGKTTVKELTAHILSRKFDVHKNRGTENNLVGVPKTLFQLDRRHRAVVLELGTNRPGEIERLAAIASPEIGVITQIGASHLEGLGSLEGVREEKLSLIRHVKRGGAVVLNGTDPMLKNVTSGVHRVLRAGFSKGEGDWWAEQAWCHDKGCSFRLNAEWLCETPLIGRHNVLNAVLAAAAASLVGVEAESIPAAIASFKSVAGRLQVRTIEGIHFLDDTYNSNPVSLRAALETLKNFKMREKKGVVIGDMLELGAEAEALHRSAGQWIAELLFDFVITTGPLSAAAADEAVRRGFDATRVHRVKTSAEAGRLCRELAAPGDLVLVKGSRGMQMEKVFECFITSSIR